MTHEQVAYRQDRRMEWLERAFAVGMFLLIPAVIRAQSIPVGSEFQTDSTFTKITTGDIVTTRAWYWNGAWGDYDDDGYLDLFVSNAQTYTNVLYRNDGNDVFTKVTNSGLSERVEDSIASCWADYDNDGFIDLFVTTACYPPSAECQPCATVSITTAATARSQKLLSAARSMTTSLNVRAPVGETTITMAFWICSFPKARSGPISRPTSSIATMATATPGST